MGGHDTGSAIRLRVRVGPRSPLHPLLAALPPAEQAAALLRLAEAGTAGGHGAEPGPWGGGRHPCAARPNTAMEASALVAALTRIAEVVERLAGGAAGSASGGEPALLGPSRVEQLDSAWDA